MVDIDQDLRHHLAASLLACDDRAAVETDRLAELIALLITLPPPPDPGGHFPRFSELRQELIRLVRTEADGETIEEAFLALYEHLHMIEAPYSRAERRRLDETGGYWCHAGGPSPILKAGDWIRPSTVSADLGAGNGLQCLLLQHLAPHARTVQVEISQQAVEIGKRLQGWLGIESSRVTWLASDLLELEVSGLDLIYLYRPLRPQGEGLTFYNRLATSLETSPHQVIIFSIADCLRDFLSDRFEAFYCDGHLTCLRGPTGAPRRD